MASYLKADAPIVHSPEFESGIIKLQENSIASLTNNERLAISTFACPDNNSTPVNDLLSAIHSKKAKSDTYLPTSWIPATSNCSAK